MSETKKTNYEVAEVAFVHFLDMQGALMQQVITSPLIDGPATTPILMAMACAILELAIPIDHLCLDDMLKGKLMKIINENYSGEGTIYDAVRQNLPTMSAKDKEIVSKMFKQEDRTTH